MNWFEQEDGRRWSSRWLLGNLYVELISLQIEREEGWWSDNRITGGEFFSDIEVVDRLGF